MDFGLDATTIEQRDKLLAFMDDHVHPAEAVFEQQMRDRVDPWTPPPILDDLKAEAKRRGLWNLFLPGKEGAGLTNLQYASLAEITGHSLKLAQVALNCQAPDSGNMEVLSVFGTEEQKTQWLEPLLEGEFRSAFAMTEPDVASSDATNISTSIARDGDEYVINGRKWFITGALNPNCKVFIVMGKTDPTAARHRQQSMILVPRDTPGISIKRGLTLYGYDDADHGGHAEMEFKDVRVPASNIIKGEGEGFAIAQSRLGPGRIHHCMRAIGVGERAIELMCRRASSRMAFGKPIADQGVVQDWIAESRIRLEQLRLLVLRAAWQMDTVGNKGAHSDIQAIKVAAPNTVEWILDKAIQVHGAGGLSQDFPLAEWAAAMRSFRFADGPDEVHKRSIARDELLKYA